MNFAATLARGLFPGSEVEGRPASESANPANLGEAEGGSLEDQELTQEEESPVSAEKEMLPIGDAVPEGEHVRTLRVYSKSSSPSPTAPVSAKTCPDLSSTAAGVPDEERRAESGCREVQVLRVFREPDVMIAPNLITKEQCLHLLNLSEGKWTRSKTSIGMTSAPQTAYKTTESQTRTSYSVMLEEAQTPGVVSVELLACALARLPLQHLESLVLVRYAEGEYFAEHHDGGFRPKTVLLYLNDVEDGGYTHFTRLGLKIAPSQGSGAVWSNVTPGGQMDFRTLHAGVAPTKGTKYVVNCFFNEAVVRHERPPAPLPLEPPQGIQNAVQHPTGAVPLQPGQSEKDTAQRDIASGRYHAYAEHAQLQQRQQQLGEGSQIGESQHRQIWGAPSTDGLGKKLTACPSGFFPMPQQLWQQHQVSHLSICNPAGVIGDGVKLPVPPFGFPVTATGSPPAGWHTHAPGGLPLDRRWV
ncbi:2OG-Fe(II) oxygenase family protein, putative [Eimeria maxima]|uniref:2OG-Fe(II) oxygenase family protein, putative n=1 Tax=Eimeria maxima TaxID=5804 RepID=U6M4G9_EIMMA|nr:2OG-Fe(II) oxygenase family protein, putative [Eimeria maxima]CDJ59102.1 2OG-Fe(II) oxygenase family protein, putative [Eimeria maxima]